MKTKIYAFILLCMLFSFSQAQYLGVSAYKVTSLQPSQPGTEVGNCIDNNDATMYHSQWSIFGIPDQLDFYFQNVPSINKIEYTPRTTQTNGVWTKVDVYYSTQDAPNTFIQVKNQLVWAKDNSKKIIDLSSSPIFKPYIIRFRITEAGGNFSSCAEMRFYSLVSSNKVPIIVAGTTASSQETQYVDNSIGKSFDGNSSTIYHSQWTPTFNIFPIALNYHFDGTKPIDYLRYIPRQDGNRNGFFGRVSILYNTNTNATFILLMDYDFGMKGEIVNVNFPSTITPANIKILVQNGLNNFASCAEMEFYSLQKPQNYEINDPIPPANSLSTLRNKVLVTVTGTSASNQETQYADNSIGKSFDGDTSTIYHSQWTPTSNVFPITLNYHFDGTKPINNLRYIPRQDGNKNGLFGKVSILYNTNTNATFIPLMDYDFGMKSEITDVYFPNTITPANIKIVVQNGMNNFASCAEMEFYLDNTSLSTLPYRDIFADSICSELKPNVTQTTIDGIADPFYKALAQYIFNKTYNKKYRVQSYEVYPTLDTTKNRLKTSAYDSFENMTGIVFAANSKIVLFVDSTPSNLFLKVHDFANEANPTDNVYSLKAGLNVIDNKTPGLGYISYYSDNSTLPPVKINIVSGALNGYYDTATSTPEEWKTLISNKAYSKLDLRGKYIHLVYDKAALSTNTPDNPVELINAYDKIVRQQRILMGLFKYGKSPKNRQFAYTESKEGWYAGGLGAHFDLTWGSAGVTSASNLEYWGVGHELGHVNQIRPNLRWLGLIEVSNNIYAAWNEYTLSNQVPRLEREPFKTTDTGANLEGGKINKSVNYTLVGKKNVLGTFAERINDYNFLIFPPFWQLELYYQVAGAGRGGLPLTDEEFPANVSGVDYAHWYGYVAEKSRNTDATNLTNGQLSMEFVKNTCEAVQEDLTDFFIKAGFLRPINATINDYGVENITVTQEMIDATIAEIKRKNYAKPISPVINYINAHNVKVFRYKLPLSGITGAGVTVLNTFTGTQLRVDQVNVWRNVVAYEVYDTTGNLARISLAGIGDTTNNTTIIEYPAGSDKVYAVGYDGSKILVYPNLFRVSRTSEVNKENKFTVYPNPAKSSDVVKLELVNSKGKYVMSVYSLAGSLVLQSQGDIKTLNDSINKKLSQLNTGVYLIYIKDENGTVYSTKLIVN